MPKNKIHRVTDSSSFTRHYRKFDYEEIARILRTGDTAFFESTEKQPLKRQTAWKAAKKLSKMVGKKVSAVNGDIKVNGNEALKGYLFIVVDEEKAEVK